MAARDAARAQGQPCARRPGAPAVTASAGGNGTKAAEPQLPPASATESVPPPRPAYGAVQGGADRIGPGSGLPGPAGQDRPADGASTRRKSVVFEEDDELDVPDFLK